MYWQNGNTEVRRKLLAKTSLSWKRQDVESSNLAYSKDVFEALSSILADSEKFDLNAPLSLIMIEVFLPNVWLQFTARHDEWWRWLTVFFFLINSADLELFSLAGRFSLRHVYFKRYTWKKKKSKSLKLHEVQSITK